MNRLGSLCGVNAEKTELRFVPHRQPGLVGLLRQGIRSPQASDHGVVALHSVIELIQRDPTLALADCFSRCDPLELNATLLR